MVVRIADLECHILRGEYPSSAERDLYAKAYRLWSQVWSATFQELDGDPTCHSDNFCRQTRIVVITHLGEPIALTTEHDVDFSLPTARADSYFKIWSDEAIAKLTKDGPRIIVGSGTVVHPDYRGDLGGGLKVKNLIIGLGVRCLYDSDADALMAIMRCHGGLEQIAARFGGTVVQGDMTMHNQKVELTAFYRRALLEKGYHRDLSVERLWDDRIEHGAADELFRKAA